VVYSADRGKARIGRLGADYSGIQNLYPETAVLPAQFYGVIYFSPHCLSIIVVYKTPSDAGARTGDNRYLIDESHIGAA